MLCGCEPLHTSDRWSAWSVWSIPIWWSRSFRADIFLICMILLMIQGGSLCNLHDRGHVSRFKCLLWSYSYCETSHSGRFYDPLVDDVLLIMICPGSSIVIMLCACRTARFIRIPLLLRVARCRMFVRFVEFFQIFSDFFLPSLAVLRFTTAKSRPL